MLKPLVAPTGDAILSQEQRGAALERFYALPSGREKAGRFWKFDLDNIDLDNVDLQGSVAAPPLIDAPQARGLIACSLAQAVQQHREIFERSFGIAADAQNRKFAALATALVNTGAFIYVPADVSVDDPVVVTYAAAEHALFPYTLVVVERGARVTVIERLESHASNAFVCGIAEVVTAENAQVVYASSQMLPEDARIFFTRAARPGKDAQVQWAAAELGAALSVSTIDTAIDAPGVDAQISSLFFPHGDQHVDLVSTVEHNVGDAHSQTLVKSAATDRGQARYLGNIRIAARAQGSEAALRDDALLLSKKSHIDSVPALEIAANDVRAFHGATVGALDEESIFYMTSRGIDRNAAEKMIALGFFEPVIDRFPTQALRESLRRRLEAKIG
ncbi:MAG: Fe-S cluster assembly protein SufD [Vulcanimicrobiaceae bacterium]